MCTDQGNRQDAQKGQEVEQLRNLFDSIDRDKSGTIEMNEYFLF
jgi:Ca2+-binding EF-hand superfamily protein